MSSFKSNVINEINVITPLSSNDDKYKKFKDKCNSKLLKQFFIYNLEHSNNGKIKNFKYEVERILCNTKIIKETSKYNFS